MEPKASPPTRQGRIPMTGRKAVTYDPDVIMEHAEYLYYQAAIISRVIMIALGVVGAVGGLVFGALLGLVLGPVAIVTGLFGCLAGGWMGARLGKIWAEIKTFTMKLDAQTALCQREIEQNTRPT